MVSLSKWGNQDETHSSGRELLDEAQIRTLMCVPLKDHRRQPVGILQLDTRDHQSRFTPEDLDVLTAVAGQIGVAVDNARLLDAAAQEQRRLALLAEAGAALASALDLEAISAAVAGLVVPRLADLCLVDLLEEDGSVRRIAAVHVDPGKQALVDQLRLRHPLESDGSSPVLQVLRTGRPDLAHAVPDRSPEADPGDAEFRALVRRLGPRSSLAVPLVARGRTLGVISLIATESERRYGPDDLGLSQELAHRAAWAIDNAALYRAAQEARQRTEEAGRSKDLFLAMLSHELRTPLTPILTAVSARLEQGVGPELRPELEMIRRNVALEARLIDDLLDLSRIERGRLRLDRETVDVHRVIAEAVEICRDETFVAGLEVSLRLAAADHHIEGDHARILQIIWNLIGNAAKFTPAGGTLTIRTGNAAPGDPDAGAGRLIIEFEDTGRGIEPGLLPRVFDAFEQGKADLHARFGGLGLGLAISRSLAEAHGGSLTARSPGVGLGTTFRLELATAPAPAPMREDASAPLPPERSLKVLVVEDNRDTLRFLSLVLGRRGHAVRTASSLSEARVELVAGDLELLISDIELPDGTGLELMRELSGRGVPGIAMSGFGTEEDVRQSREAGFFAHLAKPVEFRQLEDAIRRAFASAR
jgi:signal transduction histidine kinase